MNPNTMHNKNDSSVVKIHHFVELLTYYKLNCHTHFIIKQGLALKLQIWLVKFCLKLHVKYRDNTSDIVKRYNLN